MVENLTGMATRDHEAVVSGGKTGRGGSPEAKGAMDGREGVEETKGPMGTTSGHGDRTKRHSRLIFLDADSLSDFPLDFREDLLCVCILLSGYSFLFSPLRNPAWATETVTTWTKITLHWNPAFYSLQILSLSHSFFSYLGLFFFDVCCIRRRKLTLHFLAGNLTANTWRLLLSVCLPVFSERILPGYSFLNYCVLQWAI